MANASSLRRVAARQRYLVITYGVYTLALAMFNAFSRIAAASALPELSVIVFMTGMAILLPLVILSIIFSWQLSEAMNKPGFWALLLLIPCFGLLYLGVQSSRASKLLQDHGVRVGFFGASDLAVRRALGGKKKRSPAYDEDDEA